MADGRPELAHWPTGNPVAIRAGTLVGLRVSTSALIRKDEVGRVLDVNPTR